MQPLKKQSDAAAAASCPTCAQPLEGEGHVEGEVLTCPGCDAELEVVGLNPLRLAEAPEVEEDWGE
jgi:alpha-aminoadipate carrier protein LysW